MLTSIYQQAVFVFSSHILQNAVTRFFKSLWKTPEFFSNIYNLLWKILNLILRIRFFAICDATELIYFAIFLLLEIKRADTNETIHVIKIRFSKYSKYSDIKFLFQIFQRHISIRVCKIMKLHSFNCCFKHFNSVNCQCIICNYPNIFNIWKLFLFSHPQ